MGLDPGRRPAGMAASSSEDRPPLGIELTGLPLLLTVSSPGCARSTGTAD
jgi:hypothetical protein